MKPEPNRLLQAVVPAAGERLQVEGSVVEEAAVPAEKAPSWQECENTFWEASLALQRGQIVKFRMLTEQYAAQIKALECNAEDGAFGGNVRVSDCAKEDSTNG